MFAKGLPVHTKGGMEVHVEELAKGLVEIGHEVKFLVEEIKYKFQIKRFPFSIIYKILEKLVNKYYNTYESTFANIFPAYEIYFKLRVIK